MPNARANYTAFVDQGEDRRETARFLVATAREHGIDQRSIQSTHGGFNITEELADVIYSDAEDDETTEPPETSDEGSAEKPAKTDGKTTTSGNRAAKNTNSKEE